MTFETDGSFELEVSLEGVNTQFAVYRICGAGSM